MTIAAAPTQVSPRYQLLNQLGAGGMGVVHRALDRLSGQVVALKQVTVDSGQLLFASQADTGHDSQTVRLALAHEFKTLASLRHPNIVSVIDYGFDAQHQPYFTMTLLENAQTILQAGAEQPVEVQYGLLMQLLQALLYLHRRGILHRDLKPGNVVAVNGEVKVLDFGLSVAHGEGGGPAGTLAYMAPELLEGASASEASDLYAFGLIGYEMLAGRHPFR
ncbi:MAG TPA: serine/threonine-protein kinase, partial [Aggregatilineales bacterium]|nr:serine/threonine-protein kinase [Aggregatilineales bacterium]